jgi:hypothetical protein
LPKRPLRSLASLFRQGRWKRNDLTAVYSFNNSCGSPGL